MTYRRTRDESLTDRRDDALTWQTTYVFARKASSAEVEERLLSRQAELLCLATEMYNLDGTVATTQRQRHAGVQPWRDSRYNTAAAPRRCTTLTGQSLQQSGSATQVYNLDGTVATTQRQRHAGVQPWRDSRYNTAAAPRRCTTLTGQSLQHSGSATQVYNLDGTVATTQRQRHAGVQPWRDSRYNTAPAPRRCTTLTGQSLQHSGSATQVYNLDGTVATTQRQRHAGVQPWRDSRYNTAAAPRRCTTLTGQSLQHSGSATQVYNLDGTVAATQRQRHAGVQPWQDSRCNTAAAPRRCTTLTGQSLQHSGSATQVYNLDGTVATTQRQRHAGVQPWRDSRYNTAVAPRRCTTLTGQSLQHSGSATQVYNLDGTFATTQRQRHAGVQPWRDSRYNTAAAPRRCTT